ncbi:hypothetical protein CERSUDRAFT_107070 [Gelatoporia subvermispora B]|uniref:Tubulin nucleotide-binding domain-like protein n=1 Tax=Ceriporiopsis subvermispora (strain B) TaxID=914234 RepID=M2QSN7_CERS8|nr:hypothetical protein CERSUDRAFT_107070 [Gelatoporia subvermispora B]
MKEIIYIQAGSLANHIGTHFWNTQEGYFTYEEGDDPFVTHDVSFREGVTRKGEPTFCPRVLIFDRKANFGTLSSASGLYGDDDVLEAEQAGVTWTGDVLEYRQAPIPKSKYHVRLEEGAPDTAAPPASDIRCWSDYSRVDFHPRSLQKLPDHADWESLEGDWNAGREEFAHHDLETSLMEDNLRQFVEECDALQGIQLMHDTASFGGFTNGFLTAFRDEFFKLPCLAFPLLSSSIPGSVDQDNVLGIRKALNDALCLRGLNELCNLSVPLQAPSTWSLGEWTKPFVNFDRSNIYQTSALLSSHIETATLPLRLKGTHYDISSLCEALNGSGPTPFSHLSGVLPLSEPFSPESDMRRLYDLSVVGVASVAPAYSFSVSSVINQKPMLLSRLDVTRGLTKSELQTYDNWTSLQEILALRLSILHSIHAPAYPLPNSFPKFFETPTPTHSTRLLSSLSTTSQSTRIFVQYATLVEDAIKRHTDVTSQMGLEADELKELRDDLWAICDAFPEGEIEQDVDLGEDEE